MQQNSFHELLTRFLLKEATSAETQEVEAWLQSDPGNQVELEKMRKLILAAEIANDGKDIDVNSE